MPTGDGESCVSSACRRHASWRPIRRMANPCPDTCVVRTWPTLGQWSVSPPKLALDRLRMMSRTFATPSPHRARTPDSATLGATASSPFWWEGVRWSSTPPVAMRPRTWIWRSRRRRKSIRCIRRTRVREGRPILVSRPNSTCSSRHPRRPAFRGRMRREPRSRSMGCRVVIIGIEDLLHRSPARVGPLEAATKTVAGHRRLALLYPDRIDWGYVRERTSDDPRRGQRP